jgi:hypothetical protein
VGLPAHFACESHGRHAVAFAKHSTEMRLALEAVGSGDGGDAQGAAHGIRQRPRGFFDAPPLNVASHSVRFAAEYHVQIARRNPEGIGHGGGRQIRIVEITLDVISDLHTQRAGERAAFHIRGRHFGVGIGDEIQNRPAKAAPRGSRHAVLHAAPNVLNEPRCQPAGAGVARHGQERHHFRTGDITPQNVARNAQHQNGGGLAEGQLIGSGTVDHGEIAGVQPDLTSVLPVDAFPGEVQMQKKIRLRRQRYLRPRVSHRGLLGNGFGHADVADFGADHGGTEGRAQWLHRLRREGFAGDIVPILDFLARQDAVGRESLDPHGRRSPVGRQISGCAFHHGDFPTPIGVSTGYALKLCLVSSCHAAAI